MIEASFSFTPPHLFENLVNRVIDVSESLLVALTDPCLFQFGISGLVSLREEMKKTSYPRKNARRENTKKASAEAPKTIDIGSMPQFLAQQGQSLSTYQALPPLVLSRRQLIRREDVKNEETKLIVLDENPEVSDWLDSVKEFMNNLESNIEKDRKAKTMSIVSFTSIDELSALLHSHTLPEHKKILGGEIHAKNGGELFYEYLKALSPLDKNDATAVPEGISMSAYSYKFSCKSLVVSVCWKSSEANTQFSTQFGRSGAFKILVDDITDCVDNLGDSEAYNDFIKRSISTLHNCAKVSENKTHMKDAKVAEAMALYQKVNNTEICMLATLTLSYVIELDDNRVTSMIKGFIQYLMKAVASPDHKYDDISAEDLVSALTNLAGHDGNKEAIVNEGVLPMLVELLKKGTASEKTAAAKAVWVLSFSSVNQEKILENKEMIKSLKVLSKMDGDWRASATGAIWVLEEEKRRKQAQQPEAEKRSPTDKMPLSMRRSPNKGLPMRKNAERARNRQDVSSVQHIMISYQWDCQKLMIRMKDKLQQTGYKVWIDIESMGGSTLQAMAEAVENAAVVLVCMSSKYKDSPNCRTEAEYAYRLGKPLVPLMVEQSYSPDGWLGALQGAKLYYDFSNIANFESVFPKLAKELGNHGKISSEKEDSASAPVSVSPNAALPRPLQSQQTQVKDWKQSDIKDWASKHNVAMKALSSLDGDTLLFLKVLKNTAPEFYYRFAYDNLGMKRLRDLLNLNKALEKLAD